uniref:Elongator complex protein 4 isoform X2 n=1 Tax=Rhizophora mucronata TaxID=61149 RepID=A0A2P2L0Q6_RHIMU
MLLLLLPSHLCFFHHPCLKDCSTWLTHYFLSEQFQTRTRNWQNSSLVTRTWLASSKYTK